MSQTLATQVLQHAGLDLSQMRLGTNCTPKPFFHPTLELNHPINLRTMRFVQVDHEGVLKSMSSAISKSAHLEELSVWTDEDSGLSLDMLLGHCLGKCSFHLRMLDLRGFSRMDMTASSLWATLSPTRLRELTMQFGDEFLLSESGDF